MGPLGGPAVVVTSDREAGVQLSVVVPAYNEAARLADSLLSLRDGLCREPRSWEIVVVDDGSQDGTPNIAEAFGMWEPRVRVLREPHRGKGGAVKAGLLAARGAHCFMCDADMSMPIADLARFFEPSVGEYDVAIGTREGAASRRIGEPLHRHLMGRLFNRVVQRAALPGIEDSQCGFKMFTRAAVHSIFPLVSVDGWAFDLEVLVIARAQQLRMVQVPIDWHYRPESRVRMVRDGAGMLRELVRIRARARRGEYAVTMEAGSSDPAHRSR